MNIFDEIEKKRALDPDHIINVYSLRDHTFLGSARYKVIEDCVKTGSVFLVDENNAVMTKKACLVLPREPQVACVTL
ncbi:MAG TPA: hypothetical protein VED16_04045 [Candidatus Acidoferrum sp.]|nr:hypothetical protein [Candidatus Acidoferrum sp.]